MSKKMFVFTHTRKLEEPTTFHFALDYVICFPHGNLSGSSCLSASLVVKYQASIETVSSYYKETMALL